MASTYTPLGVELQATGENAGTWGTKTNTNLQLIEQISGGFTQQALTSGGTVTLTSTDGGTGDVLAGLIGSFLAQGLSKIDAARFSVAIHGAAGDKFSKNKGVRGLTATKLIKIINEEML